MTVILPLPPCRRTHYALPASFKTDTEPAFNVGEGRIMYSMDSPYVSHENARAFLENASISDEEREKITHINAEKLFRL